MAYLFIVKNRVTFPVPRGVEDIYQFAMPSQVPRKPWSAGMERKYMVITHKDCSCAYVLAPAQDALLTSVPIVPKVSLRQQ